MLILGIDPGTARIGIGLIRYENKKISLEGYGCIETKPDLSDEERLLRLYNELDKLIKKQKTDLVAIEKIFFFKNQKTVVGVSQARGVILLAAAKNKKKIMEFTPLQIKQALTGYGRAEKKQIQQMVKAFLGLKEIPKPDDAADALAAAICCAHFCPAPIPKKRS